MARYEDLVSLQNLSEVEQSIVFEGRLERIMPYGRTDLPWDIAQKFLAERSRWIREFQPVQIPPIAPGEEVMWVANMTGNPFLPKKCMVTRVKKGSREEIEVDNPIASPHILSYKMSIGQRQQPGRRDPSSLEILNLPKVLVQVPPYTRVRVGVNCGNWLLRRDAIQEDHHTGKIVKAQEPSDHEPNTTWPLDEIRLFAGLVDSTTFVRHHPEYGDVLGPEEGEYVDEEARKQAKTELLHKLYFRLVDERYPRINRTDFADYKNAIGYFPPEAQTEAPKRKNRKSKASAIAAMEAMSGD